MPRQTEDIDTRRGVLHTCDGCGRSHWRRWVPSAAGGNDASARVAGWRISGPEADATVICPADSGVNEDYWRGLERLDDQWLRTLMQGELGALVSGQTAPAVTG